MTKAELIEATARALCVEDMLDPDEDVISGQAAGFTNYGPRWQANERSENTLGGRNYVRDAKAALAVIAPAVLDMAADEADVYGAWHFANDDGLSGFDKMHLAATEIADEIRALHNKIKEVMG